MTTRPETLTDWTPAALETGLLFEGFIFEAGWEWYGDDLGYYWRRGMRLNYPMAFDWWIENGELPVWAR